MHLQCGMTGIQRGLVPGFVLVAAMLTAAGAEAQFRTPRPDSRDPYTKDARKDQKNEAKQELKDAKRDLKRDRAELKRLRKDLKAAERAGDRGRAAYDRRAIANLEARIREDREELQDDKADAKRIGKTPKPYNKNKPKPYAKIK